VNDEPRPADTAAMFRRLRELALPLGDYAVFGSGPLAIRGWIEAAADLDVVCRGAAWEEVRRIGTRRRIEEGGIEVEIVALDGGALTFGRRWALGGFDVDALIDTAEIIDGLPFVRLEHVAAFKRAAGRPKDRAHLEAMRRHGAC
jgi:hypothetical protein